MYVRFKYLVTFSTFTINKIIEMKYLKLINQQ